MSLTQLPPEIIHSVFTHVDPPDLARLPAVCRLFYRLVTEDPLLFKHVYLRLFDLPPAGHLDWPAAIKDIVRLLIVCRINESVETKMKKFDMELVHRVVTFLMQNASRGPKNRLAGDDGKGKGGGDDYDDADEEEEEEEDAEDGLRGSSVTSRNADVLRELFADEANQRVYLCRSWIFERARAEFNRSSVGPARSRRAATHQMSAHLHCLFGAPVLHAHPTGFRTRSSDMAPFASSKVYDLRQYTAATRWGPFMRDGSDRVDWEMAEAVMIVIGTKLHEASCCLRPMSNTFFAKPFSRTWSGSYRSLPDWQGKLAAADGDVASSSSSSSSNGSSSGGAVPGADDGSDNKNTEATIPTVVEDPYGVTGTWVRAICFLNWSHYYEYNFTPNSQPAGHVPRAVVSMNHQMMKPFVMKLRATRTSAPGPEDGQALPVVHFRGRSLPLSVDPRHGEAAGSAVRGTVRLTKHGDVRWTACSFLNDGARWNSEGVQVGGLRSAKGILGNWFDAEFHPEGPTGASAFWKISDSLSMPMSEICRVTKGHSMLATDSDDEDIDGMDHDMDDLDDFLDGLGGDQGDEEEEDLDEDINMADEDEEEEIGNETEEDDWW